jgi:GNAT superfamily N-acetyltransferase
MSYVIRRIEAAEWREFRALRFEALQDSPTAFGWTYEASVALPDEEWRGLVEKCAKSEDQAMFVAVDESGDLVGLTGVFLKDADPKAAFLFSVYVSPEHRGASRAIATLLQDTAIAWARDETDAVEMKLDVSELNERGRAFYLRTGWTDTGATQPLTRDPSVTLIEMRLDTFR